MIDALGRAIDTLRLSLTERCGLGCAYCRAQVRADAPDSELGVDEALRIVRCMVSLGINRVRLTGGEPLMRADLETLVGGISAMEGAIEVALTTNAQGLAGRARALREAGLSRVNISLDSLDPVRYRSITAGGSFARAAAGIEAAFSEGLPVKLNVVLMRGVNEGEADDFIELARTYPLDVRFIEWMPLGVQPLAGRGVPEDEVRARHPELRPLPQRRIGQPARDWAAPGFRGRVGFISPLSGAFCDSCTRVRVTADGMLRPCLGQAEEVPLRPALAQGEAALRETIAEAIRAKPARHGFAENFFSNRDMSRIGG